MLALGKVLRTGVDMEFVAREADAEAVQDLVQMGLALGGIEFHPAMPEVRKRVAVIGKEELPVVVFLDIDLDLVVVPVEERGRDDTGCPEFLNAQFLVEPRNVIPDQDFALGLRHISTWILGTVAGLTRQKFRKSMSQEVPLSHSVTL